MALRISTDAFDDEIEQLIDSACEDLRLAGVKDGENEVTKITTSPLLQQAIKTYVKLHFGTPQNPELLMKAYNEQKGQLQQATGYTEY